MAEPRHKMDDDEIGSLIGAEIDAAEGYYRSSRKEKVDRALDYYQGKMPDVGSEKGRSSVVDHTVQDVMGWILPGLLRVFFSVDRVVVYEGRDEKDQPAADQATDYVNHIVLVDGKAYQVFSAGIHDGLLHGNGIIKHWWDPKPDKIVRKMLNLSDEQFIERTASDDVEVLEHTEKVEMIPTQVGMDPLTGAPIFQDTPITLHDVRVSVAINNGSLKLKAVPREHFRINSEATCIDDARFVAERLFLTRSELREMGFSFDDIDKIPAGRSIEADSARQSRSDNRYHLGVSSSDRATEELEIWECYAQGLRHLERRGYG